MGEKKSTYWSDDNGRGSEQERTTLQAAFDDYMTFHETKNTSAMTIANYRRSLSPFLVWLSESGLAYVDQLRVKHLRGYVKFLQQRTYAGGLPLADTTIYKYALEVLIFCHWLEREGLIEKTVTENFELPKYEEREIPALTHDDFESLLAACEEGPKEKPRLRKALTARNRAILSVFFDAGIRRSELAGLRLGDVDRQGRLLYVKRKGRKWQQVPISYEGFKPLHEYIIKHRPYLASLGVGTGSKRDDPVFLSGRGGPLKLRSINGLFDRLRERANIIDKPVYPHQGRRYMATKQLSEGRNPLDVQRQMGHTTLAMTNKYFSQTTEGLKKSHELYSPLRKKSENERSSGLGSGYYED
jgi:site-specific recombinase XerD